MWGQTPHRTRWSDGGQVEEIKRLEPPSPMLRPTLKLPPARFTLRRTRRHDKSAGQVRCLNTPSCIMTKPRPRASAQSCAVWWRRCNKVGSSRCRRGAPTPRGAARGLSPSCVGPVSTLCNSPPLPLYTAIPPTTPNPPAS